MLRIGGAPPRTVCDVTDLTAFRRRDPKVGKGKVWKNAGAEERKEKGEKGE